MKDTASQNSLRFYAAPLVRVVEMRQEFSFLASNLEPIDGGDNPDIEW